METQKKYTPQVWKDEYVVNISKIDSYNRNFFDVMNMLIDAINEKKCAEIISDAFFKLTNYVENYLIDEELYYKEFNYPKFNEQKEDHNLFINKISQFQQNSPTDPEEMCIRLLEFLEEWFENHLLKQDHEAVVFLLEKGVK